MSMLSLVVTVTTAGTRVQVSTDPLRVRTATFDAPAGNTGDVYLGGVEVTSATSPPLGPGDRVEVVFRRFADESYGDLSMMYVDAANNGDSVRIWYVPAGLPL